MKKKYEARYPVPPEEFYSEFTFKEEKPEEKASERNHGVFMKSLMNKKVGSMSVKMTSLEQVRAAQKAEPEVSNMLKDLVEETSQKDPEVFRLIVHEAKRRRYLDDYSNSNGYRYR